jgi:hypothetical protein
MKQPGFKLYTCDCGEIVIEFTSEVDEAVKKEMLAKGHKEASVHGEEQSCPECGDRLQESPTRKNDSI